MDSFPILTALTTLIQAVFPLPDFSGDKARVIDWGQGLVGPTVDLIEAIRGRLVSGGVCALELNAENILAAIEQELEAAPPDKFDGAMLKKFLEIAMQFLPIILPFILKTK